MARAGAGATLPGGSTSDLLGNDNADDMPGLFSKGLC